jgi:hypothetical protein
MKKIIILLGLIIALSSGVFALLDCFGANRSFTSLCSNISDGSCLAHEYYTTVAFTDYPCEWTGSACGVYASPCSTTTTTTSPTTTSTPTSTTPSTTFGFVLPNGNFGTLPGLNGTGGITIGNGTISNMSCTGFCIIGLKKEEFELYAALMITILVMLAIKPFKLGASASAISLLFFTNIMGWTIITTSATLIFLFIALGAWIWEARE